MSSRSKAPVARRCLVIIGLVMALAGCTGDDPDPPQSIPSTSNADDAVGAINARAAEWLGRMAQCLTDQGWTAEIDEDGSMIVEEVQGPDDEAFAIAQANCEDDIGPAPTPPPMSDEIKRAAFEDMLALHSCLVAAGYDLSAPPSVDFFVENFEANPWHPYKDIPDSQLDAAIEVCPQP